MAGEDRVRFDLQRNEKKPMVKRHQMAASAAVVSSSHDM